MNLIKNLRVLILSLILSYSLSARDQIKIVGSSTVYPFSSSVAEEFGATSKYPTPVVESTGSGGGMKLFCAGSGMNTPDITNASRRIKAKELKLCIKNGVKDITEVMIGYDGIAFAQSKSNKAFNISKKHLALAVAKEVPNKSGKLIKNPYTNWSQIDKSLPNKDIIIYGPPKSSGTRDAFEDMVLKSTFKNMKEYTSLYKKDKNKYKAYKKYSQIRQDGVYVPSGENDNLIVSKLNKNKKAFGIFGYSFLLENDDQIEAVKVNGVFPTPKNISSGKYPISRSMFFYIKNSHKKKVSTIDKYVKIFMSEYMIGPDGILSEIGLISLPKDKRYQIRKDVLSSKKLTLKDLTKK